MVTDGISKLTWRIVHVLCPVRYRLLSRARARPRQEICIVRNGKVAMLAWELKWPLNGDRLDFEVNMGLYVWNLFWATQNSSRARALRVLY